MDNFNVEELSDWIFPSVDSAVKPNYEKSTNNIDEEKNANSVPAHISDMLASIELQKQEVRQLKQEFESKLNVVNNLLSKFESPLAVLDKDHLELIQYAIKKIVKKIIYKEIKTDAKTTTRIIDELRMLVHSKGGLLNVYLSEHDYNRLINKDGLHESICLKLNESLSEGDVIVKSTTQEIRAILNDRINQSLGIKYA